MSIALYLLVLADSMAFLILFVPFGLLAYAETRCDEPWHPWELSPRYERAVARTTRWHIVAAILVVASAVVIPIRLVFDNFAVDVESPAIASSGPAYVMPLIEVSLWLVTLSAVYGPMYAVRLHVQGVRGAELIGLGLCLFPATLLSVTLLATGSGPTSTLALGVVGAVLFPLGAVVPGHRIKAAVLISACVLMLIALSDFASPANPVWLLAALAMGYMVFRAETKHLFSEHAARVQASAKVVLKLPKRVKWITSTFRTVAFIVVNAACVLAMLLTWFVGFATDASLPALAFAIAAMLIAAVGALLTALVPMAFGHSRSEIDHAAATFVAVLAAASVVHIYAAPLVEGLVFGKAPAVQLWKPVLASFAVGGALAVAYATMSGRMREFRPFMIAVVMPAVSLLPSESFFTFLPEDTLDLWSQRLIETGIIVAMLAIMWYVYGPGQRRVSEQNEQSSVASHHRELDVNLRTDSQCG